jgi:hypothetical protein
VTATHFADIYGLYTTQCVILTPPHYEFHDRRRVPTGTCGTQFAEIRYYSFRNKHNQPNVTTDRGFA